MKNVILILVLILPAIAYAQDKPDNKQSVEKRIQRLIGQMGNEDYQTREKAHTELFKIGEPALDLLREALKNKDLEVSGRAQELIERITGKSVIPKSPREMFPKPTPESPFSFADLDPEILKKLEKGLEDFLGRNNPNNKIIENLRKLFEESKSGTPDLSKMQELFQQFFDQSPAPDHKSDVEKETGITLKVVDDTMKSHIRVLPDREDGSWDGLKHGLIVKEIDPKGRAFAQGLRKHDILIFASTKAAPKDPLPGPWRAWVEWRKKSVSLKSLDALDLQYMHVRSKSKKIFVEVIRRGKSGRIIELSFSAEVKEKTRGF